MSPKAVPELCRDLESILLNINNQSSLLTELLVPNSPSSSGSSGISGSKSLIPYLMRMIETGGKIREDLSQVIKNIESTKENI